MNFPNRTPRINKPSTHPQAELVHRELCILEVPLRVFLAGGPESRKKKALPADPSDLHLTNRDHHTCLYGQAWTRGQHVCEGSLGDGKAWITPSQHPILRLPTSFLNLNPPQLLPCPLTPVPTSEDLAGPVREMGPHSPMQQFSASTPLLCPPSSRSACF